jgi:hypothetical protein
MEYFKSLTQSGLIELIHSTKKALYLCVPSVHEEIAGAISYLDYSHSQDEQEVEIHLLVDFDAQTFRQGYGDYRSVEDLIKGGFELNTLQNNRISFIISDDIGFYLFIESRSLIPADKETINAIKIDPVSMVRLKKFFFSTSENKDVENELTNAIIEESKQLENANNLLSNQIAPVTEVSTKIVESVSEDLSRNPPLNPDYKRIVEFYSNKFQYVKLKFEGSNLQHRKIEIPPKALPIADANLKKKLETKLNLFDSTNVNASFTALQQLKDEVAAIREEFLTKVKSREESLLNKHEKNNFKKAIHTFKNKIAGVKTKTLSAIASEILATKENLLIDLAEFLVENPKTLFPDHPHLWQGEHKYIVQSAKTKAEEIIYRIRWPEAHTMVDEFKLDVQFSDITFEDLKNKQFISELKEYGIINSADENQLAKFSKGIETK